MLKKFLSRFIRRNHYWRDINFDELSELYTSMMFRSLALNLVGIFIPIYLYDLGFPVWQIMMFYACQLSIWTASLYGVAHLIAKVGPKHTMLASYVFMVMTMMLLASLKELQWPLLMVAGFLALSNSLFFTAFHVDFSKVKHSEHGGKEVGWMYSMERAGAVLGPLIGGLVGFLIGAQYIFATAILLLLAGILPLLLSREPTATNQKLNFRALKVSEIKHDLLAIGSMGVENVVTLAVWPLFIGVYVFTENPYIKLGSITSISVLVSLFIARAIGRTIDKNKGRSMLRLGAFSNAILHLFRPFTSSYLGALGINLVNELVTPIYRMPATKGYYDAADEHPGNRIVYITGVESVSAFGKAVFFTFATVVCYAFEASRPAFFVLFAVGALASIGIMQEKFKALNPR